MSIDKPAIFLPTHQNRQSQPTVGGPAGLSTAAQAFCPALSAILTGVTVKSLDKVR